MSVIYLNDTKRQTHRKELFDEFVPVADFVDSYNDFSQCEYMVIEKKSAVERLITGFAEPGLLGFLAHRNLLATYALTTQHRMLTNVFQRVIEINPKTDLSIEDIADVFHQKKPSNFIIAGNVDQNHKFLTLYRGDFTSIVVPFSAFAPNATAKPIFKEFRVVDGGLAIQLGRNYEVSIYPLLYERDEDFRRSVNRQRKESEKTFGACLYRARKILGLRQQDFGLPRETILRIENGTTKSVHGETKQQILERLKLTEEALLAY